MTPQWPPFTDFETYDRREQVVRYTQRSLRGALAHCGITRWDLERLVKQAAQTDPDLGRSLLRAVQAGLYGEE